MPIHIQSYARFAVPKAFGHDDGRNTMIEHEGCRGMPKVMEPDRIKIRCCRVSGKVDVFPPDPMPELPFMVGVGDLKLLDTVSHYGN